MKEIDTFLWKRVIKAEVTTLDYGEGVSEKTSEGVTFGRYLRT